MNIKIQNTALCGTVDAIASKSHAHRLLICAALADRVTHIECKDSSEDIDATIRCLQALGADICRDSGGFRVEPLWHKESESETPLWHKGSESEVPLDRNGGSVNIPAYRRLDCGESGSTLRFLLPVSCALGGKTEFNMGGRLPARPLSPLYEELVRHGCSLTPQGVSPLIAEGRLSGGTYDLPGNISSQYISGLLFALPLLEEDSIIRINGRLESGPYVDMTLQALAEFGIKISKGNAPSGQDESAPWGIKESGRYIIEGNQKYHSPGKTVTEGDWSNAAFWLVAGAIGKRNIICKNLKVRSTQGDREILKFLERFGSKVLFSDQSVNVLPGLTRGIKIDAVNTPDIVPVLAAAAAVSEGKTVISGAGRLRLKESDRLDTVTQMLQALGADIVQQESGLVITGKKSLRGGVVSSFGDHRIAMTAAIIAAACENPVTITGAEAVNKSYPGFFDDFAKLGGIWEEVV